MPRKCAVCANFRPEANLRERIITDVSFGEHTVALCEAHRRIAERNGITTFEALREFYGESEGRRSYVPRRTSAPAPVGAERRKRGRRATDAI
ncbi:MAG: hypothetical protein AAGE52_12280 [Myxococcota bacterium]